MAGLYDYDPLPDKDYIRLLRLLRSENHQDQLRGELIPARLGSDLQYESLSYTWGEPATPGSIFVDGKRIPLTANCANAFRNLRRTAGARCLWTDAVCINQSDPEEKGHEVSMMGAIYARATRTVVYLGPGDGTVHHLRAQKTLEHGTIAVAPGTKAIFEDARQQLLSRAWFKRKWIIQEVLLSRDVLVQCGKHEFTWPELETLDRNHELGIIRLAKKYLHPSSQSSWVINGQDWDPKAKANWDEMFEQGEVVAMDSQQLIPHSAHLSRYEKYRANQTGFLMPPQLFDILYATCEFACKEPRDRIYSLLSLFARRLEIKPSYTCDETEVYGALTEQLISLGDTRLLWLEDRESWRPRWSTALDSIGPFIMERSSSRKKNRAPTDIGRLWKEVYQERRLRAEIVIDGDTWTATGIRLGTVARIADTYFEHEPVPTGAMSSGIIEHSLAQWHNMLQQLDLGPQTCETGSYPLAHIHERNRQKCQWFGDWTLDLFERPKSIIRASRPDAHDQKSFARAMAAHHGHVSFCKGMRMLVLDSDLVAIASNQVQQADEIYFLPGYTCPFAVLRKVGGGWHLVGLCWFGPLRLFPSCSGTYLPTFDKSNWQTLKIV